MEKFLYLTKPEWVDAWVNGGTVPLSCASSYLSVERHQTKTPDENLIDTSSHDVKSLEPLVRIVSEGGASLTNISIGKVINNGMLVAQDILINRQYEDGLILCVSNRKSNFIAKRFGKFACVRILDINLLKDALDEQIGVVSQMGKCSYTTGHLRNHFLKSSLDSWQDEFRLFWPNQAAREVIIPKGTAVAERIRGRI